MKNFKKGKVFESSEELVKWLAEKRPYYSGDDIRAISNGDYYYSALNRFSYYCHAIEVVEPKKLGLLLMCIKSYEEEGVSFLKDVSIICGGNCYNKELWKPVTVNEKGEVHEAVEND